MSSPLVSIIIPAYNCHEFLAETIKSAINQTWPNKEIIIINDGSSDNSLEIARSFENDIVKVFDQENHGACSARNYGLRKAKGEYIQFLDGDDILPDDKIAKQLAVLYNNPNCLIGCKWMRFSSSIANTFGEVGPHSSIRRALTPTEWLLKRHMMCPHAWLTPRDLIDRAGEWNEELEINQDGEFFYRVIAQAGKVLYSDDTIVYYRTERNRNSVSVLNSRKKYYSAYLASLTYKRIVSELTNNSLEGQIAIGNFFKELEYLFYPDYMDLVKQCRQHREIGLSTKKFNAGRIVNVLSKIMGWKGAKRVKIIIKILNKLHN